VHVTAHADPADDPAADGIDAPHDSLAVRHVDAFGIRRDRHGAPVDRHVLDDAVRPHVYDGDRVRSHGQSPGATSRQRDGEAGDSGKDDDPERSGKSASARSLPRWLAVFGSRGRTEGGILREDCMLEALESLPGLEPELLREQPPPLLVNVERFGLPSGAV